MAYAKLNRARIVKRIKGNSEAEKALRAAATRIRLIMLNMDSIGTDHDTYWALADALGNINSVINHTNYTLLKGVRHAR